MTREGKSEGERRMRCAQIRKKKRWRNKNQGDRREELTRKLRMKASNWWSHTEQGDVCQVHQEHADRTELPEDWRSRCWHEALVTTTKKSGSCWSQQRQASGDQTGIDDRNHQQRLLQREKKCRRWKHRKRNGEAEREKNHSPDHTYLLVSNLLRKRGKLIPNARLSSILIPCTFNLKKAEAKCTELSLVPTGLLQKWQTWWAEVAAPHKKSGG